MNRALLMSILLVFSATSFSAVASAQAGTCVIGTSYCVCVEFGCTDAGTGHSCAASVGFTNDTQQGYVCSATKSLLGQIDGVSLGKPCHSTTALSYTTSASAWSYNQNFVDTDSSNGCSRQTGISAWRTYSAADSDYAVNGDTLTITHVAQGDNGPVLETTTLRTVNGGVWFEQHFKTFDGQSTWDARGLLTEVATTPSA